MKKAAPLAAADFGARVQRSPGGAVFFGKIIHAPFYQFPPVADRTVIRSHGVRALRAVISQATPG